MGILDTPTAPTPPTLTLAQKQAQYKSRTLARARAIFNLLATGYSDQMSDFWSNPDGLTPAQCAAALGTSGAEYIAKASALKDFLNAQKSGTAADAPHSITANNDGTITVGA